MKKVLVILVMLVITSNLNAQIKIDVKTKFGVKTKQMQAIKIGIIKMLERVNWIKVGEVGEKYSLWIDNLIIVPDQSDLLSSIVSFDMELRTPAMFTKGKTLQIEHITLKVNTNEPLPLTNPPLLEKSLKNLDNKMHFSTVSWLAMTASTGGLNLVYKSFLEIGGIFQKDYTPAEQTMALWAGFQSIDGLYKMLKKQGEFK